MNISRIEIETIDRPYMTYDVSGVFVRHQLDVMWMEVYTHVIYIKLEKLIDETKEVIFKEIMDIDGVKAIKEVNLLLFEEREIEIKAIMDAIWQGMIILNSEKKIKYINKFAVENIFNTNESDVLNTEVIELIGKNDKRIKQVIRNAEKSNEVEDVEIEINNKNYLLSMSKMLSEEGLIGYMITIQDSNRMTKLLNINRYENQITFDNIVGKSSKLIESINQAKMFSQSDSPVLIMGESGTGKELFARSIHNTSSRSHLPFVAVNCGAIPDQLLESELFGYEGGSFTGAKSSGKTGLFEIAQGGTIFLDEIGEMPPHLQVKLLRVLQDKKIRKLGSNKEKEIDVRIISATNQNLREMVEENRFRLDVFYRINIFSLTIPPLRERIEDIRVLVDYYTEEFSQKYDKDIEKIEGESLRKLLDYEWSGNVRELQNIIERAVALNYSGVIKPEDLILNKSKNKELSNTSNSLKETIERVEKEMIADALKKSTSIRGCAKSLGVTHTLLINRMKKYEIYNS